MPSAARSWTTRSISACCSANLWWTLQGSGPPSVLGRVPGEPRDTKYVRNKLQMSTSRHSESGLATCSEPPERPGGRPVAGSGPAQRRCAQGAVCTNAESSMTKRSNTLQNAQAYSSQVWHGFDKQPRDQFGLHSTGFGMVEPKLECRPAVGAPRRPPSAKFDRLRPISNWFRQFWVGFGRL